MLLSPRFKNADSLPPAVILKGDVPIRESEQGVIAAPTDIASRMMLGAALTDQDCAC